MDPEGGGGGGGGGEEGNGPPPPQKKKKKNHKNLGFLCNTGPDPLKNHQATKPAFNVGQSSAHQRNSIKMVFSWLADDGPIIAVFVSSIPLSTKKKCYQIWTRLKKFS